MDQCYHHRLPLFFDEATRTIKKTCTKCEQIFDAMDEAKTRYTEHMGCGGFLARWLDHASMHLKAGCTKCDYKEDREV